MRVLSVLAWALVAAITVVGSGGRVVAAEAGTLTISATFAAPELQAGNSWTLTLQGATYSHSSSAGNWYTNVIASSFTLEFFGPDADELNADVGDQLAGGTVSVQMRNVSGGWSTFSVYVYAPSGAWLWGGHDFDVILGNLPADAAGYPVAPEEPFDFWFEYTDIVGVSGSFHESWYDGASYSGDIGTPIPSLLSVQDGAVWEGSPRNNGKGKGGGGGNATLVLYVWLSNTSDQTVTVTYRTENGTAVAGSDYAAASGTLTFQPGESYKPVSVTILADRQREADEYFVVRLSNAVGAAINDGIGSVTIRNDD